MEGVDFSSTVHDTQDLSCNRGASLALSWAAERVEVILAACPGVAGVRRLFSGASQAAFSFRLPAAVVAVAAVPAGEKGGDAEAVAATVRAALAREGEDPEALAQALKNVGGDVGVALAAEGCLPLAHLRFVVDVAAADGEGEDALRAALVRAEAANRVRQYQTLGPLPRLGTASGPDERGRVLPGDCEEPRPGGGGTRRLSRSVAARRCFGRRMRREFYARELGDAFSGLAFTDSLEDLCADPPAGVAQSIHNKIALFYADGNRFGAARTAADRTKLGRFAGELAELRRERLLRPLLERLVTLRDAPDPAVTALVALPAGATDPGRHLRFETLRWGGDEVIWAAPAWLGLWLADFFFKHTAGWSIADQPLTHSAGLVICDRKTPIRSALAMAEALTDGAKEATVTRGMMAAAAAEATAAGGAPVDSAGADAPAPGDRLQSAPGDRLQPVPGDRLQIEVFESADLPEDGFLCYRQRLYPGLSAAQAKAGGWFTLPGSGLDALMRRLGDWQAAGGGGPPRSQLYRWLNQAVMTRAFGGGPADANVRAKVDAYLANPGRHLSLSAEGLDLSAILGPADRRGLGAERPLGLSLALLVQLWDYGLPLAALVPAGPAAGAALGQAGGRGGGILP